MVNILFPANAVILLRNLKTIINAEVLDPEWTTKLIFDFEFEEILVKLINEAKDENHLLNNHLRDMGYETFSVVLNIGGLALFFVKYLIDLFIFAALFIIVKFVEFTQPKIFKMGMDGIKAIKAKE